MVADGPGINFEAFTKLYIEPRFKKHFGKVSHASQPPFSFLHFSDEAAG